MPGLTDDDDCSVPLNARALHDLVGPVNQMRSLADLIRTRHSGQLDSEGEAVLGLMQNSASHLQNLISGLTSYMRIAGRRDPCRRFDANAVFACALATLQPAIDCNQALVTNDPLPELYGDPNQIFHVFAGLIGNSIKFRSQSRPEIHVSAAPAEAPEKGGWRFAVRDNGIGIAPNHCRRIFGVFQRIHHDTYPGAGMGLAVAQRIVESHGGRIWAESHLDCGATFFFELPDCPDAAPRVPPQTIG